MIDLTGDYTILGRHLRSLQRISAKLNAPVPMTFDERRDMANLISLMIAEAREIPAPTPGDPTP